MAHRAGGGSDGGCDCLGCRRQSQPGGFASGKAFWQPW
ncbi:hypothetical protein BSIN_2612 [Burkholderia singularis]|uniref:Uncharacterized protein n=1 Tax=Burkholderia singularis TaxID=1503053 RepID=A0A238HBA4_9BURK|nr:hypothetical protein BSIN_2612 [Burkholderia singularis]